MQISFDVKINTKDLFRFLMNNTYRRPTGIIWIIFSAVVVWVTVYTWGDVEVMYSVCMIILASLYTIVNPVILYFKAAKQCKKNESFKEALTYTVNDESITVSQKGEEASVSWDEVWKARRYGNQIVVYITTIRAFVWPVTAIGDSYDALVDIMHEKLSDRCFVRKR